MRFVEYSEVLSQLGLSRLRLNCIYPDGELFDILAYQPEGRISWSTHHVGNADSTAAVQRHQAFFALARDKNSDLALVPEYSCPWQAILSLKDSGAFPGPGKLWVIGCESLSVERLAEVKQSLAGFATVEHEPIAHQAGKNFLDAVCYLFLAQKVDAGTTERVMLIQFKTDPMGDRRTHFERDNLHLGEVVYTLKNSDEHSIKLVTLLCSDVLNFTTTNHIEPHLRDTLLLHLQLNPEPRNATYADYRGLLFRHTTDTTELICLNWARNVVERPADGDEKCWKNLSASAIYQKCPQPPDARVNQNHHRGMYATYWHERRAQVHVLNFLPAVFHFRTTKAIQVYCAGVQGGRTGPEMLNTFCWSNSNAGWELVNCETSNLDGFADELQKITGDLSCLLRMQSDPIRIERLVALSLGQATEQHWDSFAELTNLRLGQGEHVRRITFAQDHSQVATAHRTGELRKIAVLLQILSDPGNYPVPILDLAPIGVAGYRLGKKSQNLFDEHGTSSATVIYMGENPVRSDLNQVDDDYCQMLRTTGGDERRFVMWYRDINGTTVCYHANTIFEIDDAAEGHPAACDKEG